MGELPEACCKGGAGENWPTARQGLEAPSSVQERSPLGSDSHFPEGSRQEPGWPTRLHRAGCCCTPSPSTTPQEGLRLLHPLKPGLRDPAIRHPAVRHLASRQQLGGSCSCKGQVGASGQHKPGRHGHRSWLQESWETRRGFGRDRLQMMGRWCLLRIPAVTDETSQARLFCELRHGVFRLYLG